jgi:hypothetical protein
MVALRTDSQLILIARAFWMMFGPAFLMICALVIVTSPGTGWRTLADIFYWLVLVGMLLGRWLEYQSGNARNSLGEPGTARELRNYLIWASTIGAVIWIGANIISNYLLK